MKHSRSRALTSFEERLRSIVSFRAAIPNNRRRSTCLLFGLENGQREGVAAANDLNTTDIASIHVHEHHIRILCARRHVYAPADAWCWHQIQAMVSRHRVDTSQPTERYFPAKTAQVAALPDKQNLTSLTSVLEPQQNDLPPALLNGQPRHRLFI